MPRVQAPRVSLKASTRTVVSMIHLPRNGRTASPTHPPSTDSSSTVRRSVAVELVRDIETDAARALGDAEDGELVDAKLTGFRDH